SCATRAATSPRIASAERPACAAAPATSSESTWYSMVHSLSVGVATLRRHPATASGIAPVPGEITGEGAACGRVLAAGRLIRAPNTRRCELREVDVPTGK